MMVRKVKVRTDAPARTSCPPSGSASNVMHGFLVTAEPDGTVTINARALAKIEPHAEERVAEIARRDRVHDSPVKALRDTLDFGGYLPNELSAQIREALGGEAR